MAEITRRGLIAGLATFLAAPAIVRASSIMPVRVVPLPVERMRIHAANVFNGWVPVLSGGEPIRKDGLILMERPQGLTSPRNYLELASPGWDYEWKLDQSLSLGAV